jgi:hypothetical protein
LATGDAAVAVRAAAAPAKLSANAPLVSTVIPARARNTLVFL